MAEALCEWGPNGVAAFKERARVFVIVDVLSFSTAVDVAVARGGHIIPFASDDREAALRAAYNAGAVLAGRRDAQSPLSLSPASLQAIPAGVKLVLPSPNGSRLSLMCGRAIVLAGCLRNASSVAAAARHAAQGGDIAVIPAGERWCTDDSLRPAVEDWIGAGSILDALDLPLTPEADLARAAFRSARERLDETIRGSISGQELMQRGFAEDVDLAVDHDVSSCAPVLRDGVYARY